MRFGLCAPVSSVKMANDMGYDYIEPSVTGIAAMDEEQFGQAVELVNDSPIKCEVCNVMFRPDVRLTGTGYDEEAIISYLDRAFNRIVQLGTEVVVLGSGGARRVPEDYDLEAGKKQFIHAARVVGDVAARYNLIITLEPLNRRETNIITTVKEGIEFAREIDHPNVKLLADFYHMRMEDEPMSILETAGDLIYHTHIAQGRERTYPLSREEDIYEEFFAALRNIGYDRRISIEGRTDDVSKDGPGALSLLRSL